MFQETLVQSQVRSNGFFREGSGERLGGFGAKPHQVQQGSGEGSGEGSRKPWCKAKSGSTGFREKVPEKVPQKVWEALVVQQGSTGFGTKFRRTGAKPSQVQQVL